MMAERRRDGGKRRAWREVVARQRRSGRSIRAFCRQEGVSEPAFYWWRRQLTRHSSMESERPRRGPRLLHPRQPRSAKRNQRGTAAMWAPVAVTAAVPQAAIEVLLPDGMRVLVHAAADARLLGAVLAALGHRAAPGPRPC